jgi:site-specific recombinase XerD
VKVGPSEQSPEKKGTFLPSVNFSKNFQHDLNREFLHDYTSQHTRLAYAKDLQKFFHFTIERYALPKSSFDEIKRFHVVEFKEFLRQKGGAKRDPSGKKPASNQTVNRALAALTVYYDFLMEKGLAQDNPAKTVKRLKKRNNKETEYLTDSEVAQLFRIIDEEKSSGPLHKAIVTVFFTTGIRRSSLINLQGKDYHFNSDGLKVLTITAKGDERYEVPLHPKTAHYIDLYLVAMEGCGRKLGPTDWLFRPSKNIVNPQHLDKQLSPSAVYFIVRSYAKKINPQKNITPHSARATFATSAFRRGANVYRVRDTLGHKSVQTTEKYNKERSDLTQSPVFTVPFFRESET